MKNILKYKYVLSSILLILVLLTSCFDRDEDIDVPDFSEVTVSDFSPTTGLPSTQVTITGTGFGNVVDPTYVYFNGVEVSQSDYISYSDTEIVIPVPDAATTGSVEVQYLTQIVELEGEFTVIAGATVSSMSPSSAVAGDKVIVYGDNFQTEDYDVSVYFDANDGSVEAEILSLTASEIEVIVPSGGISGEITVYNGPQELEGPYFTYPFTGLEYSFDEDDGSWVAESGSVDVSDGVLNVTFDDNGEGNISLDGSVTFDLGSYPIVAVKLTRIGDVAIGFETDYGVFSDNTLAYTSDEYTGVLNGNIYYWDLTGGSFIDDSGTSTSFGSSDEMFTATVQFNVASAIADGYEVEFIQSYNNLASLVEAADDDLEDGQYIFEFDKVADMDDADWGEHKNTVWQEDGKYYTQFDVARLDLAYEWKNGRLSTAGTNVPEDDDWVNSWVYNPEFPIYAVKHNLAEKGIGLARYFSNLLGYDDATLTEQEVISETRGVDTSTEISEGIYYWDMSGDVTNTTTLTDPVTGRSGLAIWDCIKFNGSVDSEYLDATWTMDWFITFRTVEELEAYIANGN